MKYDRTARADVYQEADFRLPRVNLFRGMMVKRRREDKTHFPMTVQPPNHTVVSGPTEKCTVTVWAGDEKGTAQKHLIFVFRTDCVCGSGQLQTKQRREWWEDQSQECVCRNHLDGSVQYFKGTQSTREGFHWPEFTSTYSQCQTSSGTVGLNNSIHLSLWSTTVACFQQGTSPRKSFSAAGFGLNGLQLKCWGAIIHGTKVN